LREIQSRRRKVGVGMRRSDEARRRTDRQAVGYTDTVRPNKKVSSRIEDRKEVQKNKVGREESIPRALIRRKRLPLMMVCAVGWTAALPRRGWDLVMLTLCRS
jgi:hypothetical protein